MSLIFRRPQSFKWSFFIYFVRLFCLVIIGIDCILTQNILICNLTENDFIWLMTWSRVHIRTYQSQPIRCLWDNLMSCSASKECFSIPRIYYKDDNEYIKESSIIITVSKIFLVKFLTWNWIGNLGPNACRANK